MDNSSPRVSPIFARRLGCRRRTAGCAWMCLVSCWQILLSMLAYVLAEAQPRNRCRVSRDQAETCSISPTALSPSVGVRCGRVAMIRRAVRNGQVTAEARRALFLAPSYLCLGARYLKPLIPYLWVSGSTIEVGRNAPRLPTKGARHVQISAVSCKSG
jgi:hypothetical protein